MKRNIILFCMFACGSFFSSDKNNSSSYEDVKQKLHEVKTESFLVQGEVTLAKSYYDNNDFCNAAKYHCRAARSSIKHGEHAYAAKSLLEALTIFDTKTHNYRRAGWCCESIADCLEKSNYSVYQEEWWYKLAYEFYTKKGSSGNFTEKLRSYTKWYNAKLYNDELNQNFSDLGDMSHQQICDFVNSPPVQKAFKDLHKSVR